MLFGAAALVVGSYSTVVAVFSLSTVGPTIGSAILALCAVVVASIGAGLIGMAWAAFVALITLPCVFVITRTLRLNGGMTWIGTISGGLVGFLAVLPFVLNFPMETPQEAALVFAIGPGLTTILGQIGGAWGGSHCYSSWVKWAQGPVRVGPWPPAQSTAALESSSQQQVHAPFQFTIRQLLWLALWLSALLSLVRLSRVDFEVAIPLLLGWTLYQAVTLAVGVLVVRHVGPWWIRRRECRST
jgi:hypothetical protein